MKKCNNGFNLLELMMAILLSSILLLVLLTIFVTVKRVELVHRDLLEILDNGRYAVMVLRRDYYQPSHVFSIAKTTYKNSRGENIYGLYLQLVSQRRQLVALGIYQSHVEQGECHFWIRSLDRKIKRQWVFAL